MAKAVKKIIRSLIIPDEVVVNKILLIRGKKVMVDKGYCRIIWCTHQAFEWAG